MYTEKYKDSGVDDTWYFLSPRYRKYRGGDRPVRRTVDDRGRWKPSTGQSKLPEEEDASMSHSKAKKAAFSENTLAYYVGSTKDETKTKWLMLSCTSSSSPRRLTTASTSRAPPPSPATTCWSVPFLAETFKFSCLFLQFWNISSFSPPIHVAV